jgi:hypothetical protein
MRGGHVAFEVIGAEEDLSAVRAHVAADVLVHRLHVQLQVRLQRELLRAVEALEQLEGAKRITPVTKPFFISIF